MSPMYVIMTFILEGHPAGKAFFRMLFWKHCFKYIIRVFSDSIYFNRHLLRASYIQNISV